MQIIKTGHPADVVVAQLGPKDRATLKEIAESESTTPGDVAVEMLSWMLSALRGDPDSRPLIILNQQGFSQKEETDG